MVTIESGRFVWERMYSRAESARRSESRRLRSDGPSGDAEPFIDTDFSLTVGAEAILSSNDVRCRSRMLLSEKFVSRREYPCRKWI